MASAVRIKSESTIKAYLAAKGKSPVTPATKGFLLKNDLGGVTHEVIANVIEAAKSLSGGNIQGDGDNFKAWAITMGRPVPSDVIVDLMNSDPLNARRHILEEVDTTPLLYKSYCSYLAGRGRHRV